MSNGSWKTVFIWSNLESLDKDQEAALRYIKTLPGLRHQVGDADLNRDRQAVGTG